MTVREGDVDRRDGVAGDLDVGPLPAHAHVRLGRRLHRAVGRCRERRIELPAAPEQVTGTPDRSGPDRRALDRHEPQAIAGPVIEDMSGAPVLPGPTGGASDRW